MVSAESQLNIIEQSKKLAAFACGEKYVRSGCLLGVGSGSTVKYLVDYLGESYKNGKLTDIMCIPTSQQTKQWLVDAKLPLSDLDITPELDICIDGADEVDSNFQCIKGGGGCLAQEKIVQHASKRFYVIGDYQKMSQHLGERYDSIPIEVIPFAYQPLLLSIPQQFGGIAKLRVCDENYGPVVTDNFNYIIDWHFDKTRKNIDWKMVQIRLAKTPGIVETGLFIDVVDSVFIANPDGTVKEWKNTRNHNNSVCI
ncbi:unnamed protein product [Caenorhabditis bovis]|uniref:ribose-5-phosphate isomerase n=1 Tax=Caenorhabditis bovis TaxID=2654633 RepID=A0A8S1F9J4_9PELO|nr:unnamed protein product [Caenorhabditis bovis]